MDRVSCNNQGSSMFVHFQKFHAPSLLREIWRSINSKVHRMGEGYCLDWRYKKPNQINIFKV